MLKIITVPNPILTTTAKKIERFDGVLKKLVKDMDQTLRAQVNPQGVGLAAPQVGINEALFIIKPVPKAKTEVFVNPRIILVQTVDDGRWKMDHEDGKLKIEKNSNFHHQSSKSILNPPSSIVKKPKSKTKLEGCLSIPKIWGAIKRDDKIFLEYQDLTSKKHKKWFSGFKALVIQHEIDHLRGVLFTQRALEQNTLLYEEKEGELKKLLTK
ncbi:peptide deformylase [Candidatus Roizmanbacteria bacterium]|nr:peptide deformylase [Candidatus Roizmanbacteria bacterium]